MTEIGGSAWHKLGLYKFLKAKTFSHLASSRLGQLDKNLYQYTKEKLVELEGEMKLYEIATDEKGLTNCLEVLFSTLQHIGEDDFVKAMRSVELQTVHERYAVLRAIVRHLSLKINDVNVLKQFFNEREDLKTLLLIIASFVEERGFIAIHVSKILKLVSRFPAALAEALSLFSQSKRTLPFIREWVNTAIKNNPDFLSTLPEGPDKKQLLNILKT